MAHSLNGQYGFPDALTKVGMLAMIQINNQNEDENKH